MMTREQREHLTGLIEHWHETACDLTCTDDEYSIPVSVQEAAELGLLDMFAVILMFVDGITAGGPPENHEPVDRPAGHR